MRITELPFPPVFNVFMIRFHDQVFMAEASQASWLQISYPPPNLFAPLCQDLEPQKSLPNGVFFSGNPVFRKWGIFPQPWNLPHLCKNSIGFRDIWNFRWISPISPTCPISFSLPHFQNLPHVGKKKELNLEIWGMLGRFSWETIEFAIRDPVRQCKWNSNPNLWNPIRKQQGIPFWISDPSPESPQLGAFPPRLPHFSQNGASSWICDIFCPIWVRFFSSLGHFWFLEISPTCPIFPSLPHFLFPIWSDSPPRKFAPFGGDWGDWGDFPQRESLVKSWKDAPFSSDLPHFSNLGHILGHLNLEIWGMLGRFSWGFIGFAMREPVLPTNVLNPIRNQQGTPFWISYPSPESPQLGAFSPQLAPFSSKWGILLNLWHFLPHLGKIF